MVVIQNGTDYCPVDESGFASTLQTVLEDLHHGNSELLIRLVDLAEIQQLNKAYRHQDKPTNVLSFAVDLPIEIDEAILGDVVICTEQVHEEAKAQHKTFEHHLIHLAVHGVLHCLGYEHTESHAAEAMESLEIKILHKLGIANPFTISGPD